MLSIPGQLAQNRADAEAALVDIGDPNGYINIYKGDVPANVEEVLSSQVVICQLSYDVKAYEDAVIVGNEAQAALSNPPRSGFVVNSGGLASFYRAFDATGTEWWQGTVSVIGGNGDLQLSEATLIEGSQVKVS